MDTEEANHTKALIEIYKRRLYERELQLAQLGVNADPSIKMEIEDIKRHIDKLEIQVINHSKKDLSTEHIFYTDDEGFARELTRFTYWYQWPESHDPTIMSARGFVEDITHTIAGEGSPETGLEIVIVLHTRTGS